MGALADGGEAVLGDAVPDQRGDDRLGALLGERIVDGVGAGIVAVALDLEFDGRIVLHDFRDAVDLDHRLGLQRSLAGVEGDRVGYDLAFGGKAVVQRNGALCQADVLDVEAVFLVTVGDGTEEHAGRACHVGQIHHPDAIHIILEGALVERRSNVKPFVGHNLPLDVVSRS